MIEKQILTFVGSQPGTNFSISSSTLVVLDKLLTSGTGHNL